MKKNKKNPFAIANSTPKNGFEKEFFDWERKKELARIKKLFPEEQKKVLEAQRALAERMNL